MKIKVLIVDDSALIRSVLKEIINSQTDMEVVGVAPDPYIARDLIKQHRPDVLTLDVEMPRMDGIEFLEKLMRLHPMPVVMVSTLTEQGSDITFRALELGAVDFVTKPKINVAKELEQYTHEITDKIRAAFRARIKKLVNPVSSSSVNTYNNTTTTNSAIKSSTISQPKQGLALNSPMLTTEKLILIGASTGGTEAIKDFLVQMPPDCPGILITQHMPETFTKSFAKRLDSLAKISVKEAEHNERVLPGHAYVAPGHSHLTVQRSGANYVTHLDQSPPVNRHRPSVDVLFASAAHVVGKNAIGLILTGMGKDGAKGMLAMKHAGAFNLAQDESSCVVFGMPKEAIAMGAVDEILPLKDLAPAVINFLNNIGKRYRV